MQARNQEEEPYLDQACENWVEAMRLTGILQSKSDATKMGFGDFGKGAAASEQGLGFKDSSGAWSAACAPAKPQAQQVFRLKGQAQDDAGSGFLYGGRCSDSTFHVLLAVDMKVDQSADRLLQEVSIPANGRLAAS